MVIVDESTGRVLDGRKWQEGLHQAVEAKEMLPLTADTSSAARVTVQRFFRQYAHVGGMTGTAVSAAGEFRLAYDLQVTPIPTHRKCQRIGLPPRIFSTAEAKRAAIVTDIEQIHREGRPVLIGTPSVEASEKLKTLFEQREIPHKLLNALFHEEEAEIVAEAGQPGRVTIATNMAGRGTDIILHEGIAECGGLHVIATELHSSERIDRQLAGRAARQGDPGSFHLKTNCFAAERRSNWHRCENEQRPMAMVNCRHGGCASSATRSGFWKRRIASNARTCCATRRPTWNRCSEWASTRTLN